MNKQKLAFKFGFAAVLFTSLLSTSIRVNAGPQPTTIIDSGDSSSSAGDNFSSAASGRPPRVPPGLRGKVKITTNPDGTVTITLTPEAQAKLNQEIATMRTNPRIIAGRQITRGVRVEKTPIFRMMTTDGTEEAAKIEVARGFQEAGLSSEIIDDVASKILALLVADNGDINRINAAIDLYNKIVLDSKLSVLRALAQDDNFKELRERLVALRNSTR
ncbi:MAG: hypothetical protein QNJ63_27130 [Calothrix sp. MO_192.B10]|nr:hypothetical protein [Calothrix sp. MO_192.B10]